MSDPTIVVAMSNLITSTNGITNTFTPYNINAVPGTVVLNSDVFWDIDNYINMFRVAITFFDLGYMYITINAILVLSIIGICLSVVVAIVKGGDMKTGGNDSAGGVSPSSKRGKH